MITNKLYQLKKQAQLNGCQADFSKLKAKSLKANPKIQLEMKKHFRWIGFMIDEIKSILSDIKKSSKKGLLSIQIGMESALEALKSSMIEANSIFSL